MELSSRDWIDRWSDHLIAAFHHDSDATLARNAEALELGFRDGLPDGVLELFRINVERTRDNPEGTVRLLQASYETTLRTIDDLLRSGAGDRP